MEDKDLKIVGLVALAMAPLTYFAGLRAWGWDSQYGFSYLVANIMIPISLGVILYAIRSNKKPDA